jgi:ribosome-binding protein aMBF1 (putative translation factor)
VSLAAALEEFGNSARMAARRAEAEEGGEVTITPEQVKAARQLLGWSVLKLASCVGVSESAVRLFESGVNLALLDLDAVRTVVEAAGVEFIAENGEGPGVRLRKRSG